MLNIILTLLPCPPPVDSHSGHLASRLLRNNVLVNLDNKRTGVYSYIEGAFLNFMPARSFIPISVKFEEALQVKLLCPSQLPNHY